MLKSLSKGTVVMMALLSTFVACIGVFFMTPAIFIPIYLFQKVTVLMQLIWFRDLKSLILISVELLIVDILLFS